MAFQPRQVQAAWMLADQLFVRDFEIEQGPRRKHRHDVHQQFQWRGHVFQDLATGHQVVAWLPRLIRLRALGASDHGDPRDVVDVDPPLAEEGRVGTIPATPIEHQGAGRQARRQPGLHRGDVGMPMRIVPGHRGGVAGLVAIALQRVGVVAITRVQGGHLRIGETVVKEQGAPLPALH